ACMMLTMLAFMAHSKPAYAGEARTDVVIIGAGISGLCAALEAAGAGASVAVIDMGSVYGGHAVMSSGMVCLIGTPEQSRAHVDDSAELASSDFIRFGEDAD